MILLFISINSSSQYGGVHTTLNRDHAHIKNIIRNMLGSVPDDR